MNFFKRLLPKNKTHNDSQKETKSALVENNFADFPLTDYDEISKLYREPFTDHYLINAWVSIAINILIRNLARADFVLERDGEEVKNGLLYNLFHRPNPNLSRYDLWKETAAWWHLEGEAFWWFGPDYSGGIPKEIYILNPVNCNRRLPVQGA
jgi:phage portal protein BeeE